VFYYVHGFEVVSVLVKRVRIFLQHGAYNLSFCMGQMVYFTPLQMLYRTSFLPFPVGLVEDSVFTVFSSFILSTNVSDTSAAPRTVA